MVSQKNTTEYKKLYEALLAADNEAQILASIARIDWFDKQNGEKCPEDMIPDAEGLAMWWESDRMLLSAIEASEKAGRALATLLDQQSAFWSVSGGRLVVVVLPTREAFRSSKLSAQEMTIEHIHERWILNRKLNTGHPLRPIVSAWHERPTPATPNTRSGRLMPARVAMVQPGDARALPRADRPSLFSPAAHVDVDSDSQMALPGFAISRQSDLPALPLALYDLGMQGTQSRGAAPLALRLWVEAILSVGLNERLINRAVAMEVSLRDIRQRLWPHSWYGYSTKRVRRMLHDAAEALDSWEAAWPWHDPDTGRGGTRRIVLITDIGNELDDTTRVVVDLPPGAAEGPQVSDTLAAWGSTSADAYRALLNLAYFWHRPGRTHRPVPGGRHWIRRSTPSAYPELSDEDLLTLVFPTQTQPKHRKQLVYRAKQTLHVLEKQGELRLQGRRVLPPLII